MAKKGTEQTAGADRYTDFIERQSGGAVRPYRADGYVNMMTKYGTEQDQSEQYKFAPEEQVPDELLTMYYEGNGLFAKIIDTPAEEAIKHGFELDGVEDKKIEEFYTSALDQLDWEENAMTAIKWARLFGGAIGVMLIDDGRGLDEPLDWENIKSIDDIRIYDRSLVQPDYTSMYKYQSEDPYHTRKTRWGMPERYQVISKYGDFTVHDSRCLVFQNGILPENTTNSIYQMWGVPEYIRIHRAIRDAEVAHGNAPKLLDRSVQPIYKMKDLATELATEDGENRVLRRMKVIDMARGLFNSMILDSEGEDYDFRSFAFTGVNDVISSSCNMLSAVTNIPQTILFGQPIGGLSSTDETSMENYYNFIERIQKRMLRGNLRYLLSVLFRAGIYTKEIDDVPPINVKFNPLWSLSDTEQVQLDLQKEQVKLARAQVAQAYVSIQAIDPSEVRKTLAKSDEFDVETMLDDYDEEELEENDPQNKQQQGGDMGGLAAMMGGDMSQMGNGGPSSDIPPEVAVPKEGNRGEAEAKPVDGGAAGAMQNSEAKPQEDKHADAEESTDKPVILYHWYSCNTKRFDEIIDRIEVGSAIHCGDGFLWTKDWEAAKNETEAGGTAGIDFILFRIPNYAMADEDKGTATIYLSEDTMLVVDAISTHEKGNGGRVAVLTIRIDES